MSANPVVADENDWRLRNMRSTRLAATEEGTQPFPHGGRESQSTVSSTVLSVDDGTVNLQALPPPPMGLVRGRNIPALPPPPALGRAVVRNAATARAGLDDDDEEDIVPAPPLALVQSPRTPPEGFSRLLSTSVSSLSPIPPLPFLSSDEIALTTPPVAPAASRTESWASDATPPPPILGRSGSIQNRVMWHTGVDVDSFIGTGDTPSSSEADDAESLIARMQSISEVNSSRGAMTTETPPALSPKESSVEKESPAGGVNGADVLTDSELPAIVSPELRRHSSSSSPGAYHANGSTTGVSPERFTSTRFHSLTPPSPRSTVTLTAPELQNSSSDGPIPAPPLSQADSCTTLVSATLVDEFSETEQSYSVSQQQQNHMGGAGGGGGTVMEHLPYAHAEPLYYKRIRTKCVAAWVVLVAVTILIFGFLGSWFADVSISNQSAASIESSNADNDTDVSSISPTTAPLAELTTDTNQQTSSHVVMWGQLTTCNDTDFFTAYPLELECGGTILIQEQVNAECTHAALAGHANITDVSRVVCRFQDPEPPATESGTFYQQATAHVIYNCVGESLNDHSGTASLPPMEVSGCGLPHDDDDPGRRRLLRSVAAKVSTSPETDYTRALQAVMQFGASSFITVGRFCSENRGRRWLLWHQFYRCERGDRIFFTNFSDALMSLNPPQDWKSLLEWLGQLGISPETLAGASASGGSNAPDANGLFGDIVLSLLVGQDNGDRKHRNRRLDDALFNFATSQDSMWDLLDMLGVRNVCYSSDAEQCSSSCSVDTRGRTVCPNCSARVAPVQASDYDARDACRQSDQGPTLELMKRLVDDSLSSKIFTDKMAALI